MTAPTLPETHIGERNYMRGLLGRGVQFNLIVDGEVGPGELRQLVRLLQAQIEVLSEDSASPSERDELLEIAREVSTLDCFYTGDSCPPACECLSARAGRAIQPTATKPDEQA